MTLVELSIVLLIGTMVMTGLIWLGAQKVAASKGAAQGKHMVTVSNGAATYITEKYEQLVSNTGITGFGNIYAPTVAELVAAGYIPNNFNATSLFGSAYAVSVTLTPAGCTPDTCEINTLVTLTAAITNPMTGRVNGPVLGAAVQVMGGDGGFSMPESPGVINFAGGTMNVTNPQGNVAGILGMRSGYNASGLAQFSRRDGQKTWTGPQRANGQDIQNAGAINSQTLTSAGATSVGSTLSVTGLTTTRGLSNIAGGIANTGPSGISNSGTLTTGGTTINGSVTVNGNTTTTGTATVGSNLTVTGNTTLQGTLAVSGATTTAGLTNTGTLSNTGSITATGDLSAGRLWLKTIVTNGSSCAGLNGYQAATAAGSIASCINGTWTTPNAATAPPPPCPSQTLTWGTTGACSASFPATASGNSATMSTNAPHSGSATYVCSNGSWTAQSSTCNMACSAQTVTWGAGCQASLGSASGGSSVFVNATNAPYSGSGTYTCNAANGTWSLTSGGGCSAPQPCSGSVAWGNSNCASSYSIQSGSGQWLSSSSSNTYGGYNLGGSISGQAYASCNNGLLSLSSKSCNYSGGYAQAYNQSGGGSAPMTVYIVSDAAANYCGQLLGSGSSTSYSTSTCPSDDYWFTWSGRVANMSWNNMVAGSGCSTDGCSCYAYRTRYGSYARTVSSLTCTNNN